MDESPKIVMVDKNVKLSTFDTETDEQRAAKASTALPPMPAPAALALSLALTLPSKAMNLESRDLT